VFYDARFDSVRAQRNDLSRDAFRQGLEESKLFGRKSGGEEVFVSFDLLQCPFDAQAAG